jgi:hypothetical protein
VFKKGQKRGDVKINLQGWDFSASKEKSGGRRTRTRMARWPPDFKSGSLPIRIALRKKSVDRLKATGFLNISCVINIEDFHCKVRKKLEAFA